ncbi:sugar ABC transporter permease [Paenibacillus athensensis]|uniref:Sugar ABC transporter permease n=1 Tax=Paenibacillus athensensis TaxID=1967502 RepID=A0A4Y8PXU2_9BACL|nr:ABC transporter permease subunit [Paenibacillus athensensis]MCD1259956.1 sugar ABC transporter permease [Paenibacillus athensensis]
MSDTATIAPTASSPAKMKKTKLKPSFLDTVKKYWIFYVMMLPAAALLFVNNYIPMAGVLIAFKNINYTKGIIASPWIGFDNFKYLFSSDAAWVITRNTIGYNIVFIILNLVIAVAFAIMFNEMRSKFLSKFHQSTMFLPFFLSWVVVSYLVYAFLGVEHGYLNKVLLPKIGVDPIEWYSQPVYWLVVLPIVSTWKGIGYYTVIYMAAIIGIDNEYYEAALIDGANKWQQIRSITLPLIAPVMITMTLLQIGRIFYADFGLFFQVTRNAGALYPSTQVIDTYVYQTFLSMGDIGMSSAAGLYQSVVGFVTVFLSNLVVRRFSKENALF